MGTIRAITFASMAIALAAVTVRSAAGNAEPAASAAHLPEALIGGWSLDSRVTTLADGKVVMDPGLSVTPKGVLIYDRFGHVAAQLSRPGRTIEMLPAECRDAEKVRGTEDTAQTILGYDAYFGTYTVDEKQGVVTHHLESALFPGDIGKNIRRHFFVAGDTLTIMFSTTLRDGTPVTRTLIWKRMR